MHARTPTHAHAWALPTSARLRTRERESREWKRASPSPAPTPARPQLIGLVFVLVFAVLGREFFSERAPGAFGTFDTSLVTLFATVSNLQQWPDDLPFVFASESTEVRVFRSRA
jgi:hypothetical protein